MKIKLPTGNIANRGLPIRIYDMVTNDIKLCESILGGVIRSVDFIYKSAGVNRPLRANEEQPQDNIKRAYYRIRLIKLAIQLKRL